jgi:RNA polymerase sigma-70 factor (ECF subfamily)
MLSLYLSMLVNETDKLDFENLYRTYGNSVLKYAKSLVHHQQNAEDLAHNAWLYMAEHFHKFHFVDEDSFKNYIMTVVKSRSTSFHRRQVKEMELFEDMGDNSIGNLRDDCEELLFSYCEKEDCQIVIESIKQLESCYRDVLNLFYLKESSPQEIAKMLCLKDSTVRQRLSRGRKKLIAILQEKGVNYEF